MTRTEKLLAELIALPSVNPAFVPPSSVGPRCRAALDDQQVVLTSLRAGEQCVADFLASVAARAGLEV